MQANQVQDKLVTATEWAKAHGYSYDKVKYLCKTGQLEFVFRGGKRWIKESSTPKVVQFQGWITVKEFADMHSMTVSWARNLIRQGKIPIKRNHGRVLVWAETLLVQKVRDYRNSRCIYWEVVSPEVEATNEA
ncbi:MAG TPA: hypothetical protein V6C76_11870 [Drouetiella sp.]